MDKKDKRISIGLYLGCLALMVVMALQLSVAYVLDETGTVANAAYLAGFDWTGFTAITGNYYYKYGMGLLYYLPIKLIKDSFWAYRGMVMVNGIFYSFIPAIVYFILRAYLKIQNKSHAVIAAVAVALIPSPLIFSTFTRGDAGIISFSWIALYFLVKADMESSKKNKIIWSILTSFTMVFIFMCHSRGVVWLITYVILFLYMRIFYKRCVVEPISAVLALALGMGLDRVLKKIFKAGVYVVGGTKHNTVSSFKFENLLKMFSIPGIKTLIVDCDGWMTSLLIGTLGIGVAGFIIAMVMTLRGFTKRHKIDTREALVNIYGFLTFAGSFAMGILFMFSSTYRFVNRTSKARADKMLYDRYTSVAFGIIVFIMLYYFIANNDKISKRFKLIIFMIELAIVGVFHFFVAYRINKKSFSSRNAIGSILFMKYEDWGMDILKSPYLGRWAQIGALFAVIFFAVLLLISVYYKKNKHYITIILTICLLGMGISSTVDWVKLRQAASQRKAGVVDEVEVFMEELSEDFSQYPIYMDKSIKLQKQLQMAVIDYKLIGNKVIKQEEVENMFVLVKDDREKEEFVETECYKILDFDENSSLSIYVKGDELVNKLKEHGYELAK